MLKSILKLFHRNDPDTSREAAEHAQEFVASHEALILWALKKARAIDYGICDAGLTKSECAMTINIYHNQSITDVQVSRRLGKLKEKDKLIVDTGLTRKNAAGRSETVWRLA